MNCVSCSKSIREGSKFCPYCGAEQAIKQSNVPAPQDFVESPSYNTGKKPSTIMPFIAFLLFVCLCCVGYFAYQSFSSNNKSELETASFADDESTEETYGSSEYNGAYEESEEPEAAVTDKEVELGDSSETDSEDVLNNQSTDLYLEVYEEPDFILPDSSSEFITRYTLEGLSDTDLRIARNEMMARHGRRFKDETLQAHFDSKSWYYGTYAPDDFDKQMESLLNEYEKKNVSLIQEIERERKNETFSHTPLPIYSVTASSELTGGDYDADNVLDDQFTTAWVEGADGAGTDEYIELHVHANGSFNRIGIASGYHKSEELFEKNAAPIEIILYSAGDVRRLYLNPAYGKMEVIHLGRAVYAGPTGIIRIKINDVRAGSTYEDACISEIVLYQDI